MTLIIGKGAKSKITMKMTRNVSDQYSRLSSTIISDTNAIHIGQKELGNWCTIRFLLRLPELWGYARSENRHDKLLNIVWVIGMLHISTLYMHVHSKTL